MRKTVFFAALVAASHAYAAPPWPPIPDQNPDMWTMPYVAPMPNDDSASFAYYDGVVTITGPIEVDTPLMLDYKIATYHWNVRSILLNSGGGWVRAGLELAGMVRRHHWNTIAQYCTSICVNVWAAGRVKSVDPRGWTLGVHQSADAMTLKSPDRSPDPSATIAVAKHLHSEGAPAGVIARMMSTKPSEMYRLTAEDVARWR